MEALEEQSHSAAVAPDEKSQKQTHFDDADSPENEKANPFGGIADKGPEALRRASNGTRVVDENEKANPLTSMFTGNRHERRRAKALAQRQTQAGILTPG